MFPNELYLTLSRYNRWMNEKLFACCADLSDEERKRDVAAPFRSIHGQWNHILLADRAWLARFAGTIFEFETLADELYSDFDELRAERALTDNAIDAFVADLTTEKLNATLRYTRHSSPETHAYPLWICVQHLFNQQIHHRGQITTLLEQLDVDFGITDLPGLPGLPTAK